MRARFLFGLLAVLLVVAACGVESGTPIPDESESPAATEPGASEPGASEPGASPSPQGSIVPVDLTVGLGYIPSVQFAPFYLAEQQGYYDEAGLNVEFNHRTDQDLIPLVGQGTIDVGIGDGTSVIPAVSQGIPVRYLATIYGKFPSIVFSKASSGIDSPADLAGKKLGTPGRYGSGWVALQAMLQSVGLTPEDLEIVDYPDYGQGAALAADQVDAATGFVNNEPVQLELSGTPASVLHVDDIVPLPGQGLIAGVDMLEENPDAIQAFIAATLRAMEEISDDPEVGLDGGDHARSRSSATIRKRSARSSRRRSTPGAVRCRPNVASARSIATDGRRPSRSSRTSASCRTRSRSRTCCATTCCPQVTEPLTLQSSGFGRFRA